LVTRLLQNADRGRQRAFKPPRLGLITLPHPGGQGPGVMSSPRPTSTERLPFRRRRYCHPGSFSP
jgi:hypothetical protein